MGKLIKGSLVTLTLLFGLSVFGGTIGASTTSAVECLDPSCPCGYAQVCYPGSPYGSYCVCERV